ncbi:CobW family GTP-binding protein [Ancylobacter mangrovi]|uniref:CobW family GTP-binding protein n=1 Tax=Ancylobacter mangrovi TaxID=2972472 RepID=UPI002163FA5D|nr:GTP-binding protein [Ancylobacter mangrovi]MCS0504757.1 GTP-binding protein [Ancylobacter mangrovi]
MAPNLPAHPTPVSLLTGFLGSGKTTVLNHLLRLPALARVAVIINEFGKIGLDHELVEATTENVTLLESGCVCCTVRGDLSRALGSLFARRLTGEIPAFDRVVIETTGLADPAPILHTLMTDRLLSYAFQLDGVIATVDAAAASATLDTQMEAVKQAAVADRILLTKTDLVDATSRQAIEARLRALNPAAPIIHAHNGVVDPVDVLNAGLYNPLTKSIDVQNWLKAEAYSAPGGRRSPHQQTNAPGPELASPPHHRYRENRHDDRISAVACTVDNPIPPELFDTWLEILMMLRGPNILRLKGIIHVEGAPAPFVIHAVQHIFHPPVILSDWPSDDRRSRIVMIGRDLTDEFLKRGFDLLRSSAAVRDEPNGAVA